MLHRRFIKIVGTHNTVNRVFHVVALEASFTQRPFRLKDKLIGKYYYLERSIDLIVACALPLIEYLLMSCRAYGECGYRSSLSVRY